MKAIVIEDQLAKLSLQKTPLWQFIALCFRKRKTFASTAIILAGMGWIAGKLIHGLFVESMLDPVYFLLFLAALGIGYGFILIRVLPAKITQSVAVWGSICYLLYNCLVLAVVIRALAISYKPPMTIIDPQAIQEQVRQQIFLNGLRPGDIVITKDGEMKLVVSRSGLRRESLLPYVTCLGAQYMTSSYQTVTANLRRVVRRRDADYAFLSQRFLAAEKCPVVVR